MRPDLANQLRHAQDLYSLTKGVLGLCEPYGPVHSFRLVHNRGAARVVCFIELESPKQQPALVRALGAKVINGSACLDIPVTEDFGGGDRITALPIGALHHASAAHQPPTQVAPN
ncbi:MAG TPA: RNA-binding protein [Burkholderiales bacterium]|nr:RNA-binding protein [Burkholderiales bacterium]